MPHGLAPLDLFINAICLFQLISRYIYYAPLELNIIPLLIILLTFRCPQLIILVFLLFLKVLFLDYLLISLIRCSFNFY
jgi:hypothetical protein